MRRIDIPLIAKGKGQKKSQSKKTKGFGYQMLGFGAGGGGPSPFIEATGGTITTDGNYTIHTFTSSGTFCVSKVACCAPDNVVSYMVVAGGGGGGDGRGGGAGAGGFREFKSPVDSYTASPLNAPDGLPVSVQTYPIQVGGGGSAGPKTPPYLATSGEPSIFSTITSTGGGRGGAGTTTGDGADGGSGGGAGRASGTPSGGSGNTPPVNPAQGTNGAPGGPQNGGDGAGGDGDRERRAGVVEERDLQSQAAPGRGVM